MRTPIQLFVTRLLLVGFLAASLVAGSPVHAEDAVRIRPPSVADLGDLAEQVIKVTKDLDDLVNLAAKDPRAVRVDMYMAYTPSVMKSRKAKDGAVFAEELVEIMEDKDAEFTLRRSARDALYHGTMISQDPELSGDIKKRSGTNRGYFYRTKVVPFLTDKRDARLRKLTQELLTRVFGSMQHERAIAKYDPIKAGSKTWSPARKAWAKHLLKR